MALVETLSLKAAERFCVICRDTAPGNWILLDKCHHTFHNDCITNYFKRSKSNCPLCRYDYSKCEKYVMDIESQEHFENILKFADNISRILCCSRTEVIETCSKHYCELQLLPFSEWMSSFEKNLSIKVDTLDKIKMLRFGETLKKTRQLIEQKYGS